MKVFKHDEINNNFISFWQRLVAYLKPSFLLNEQKNENLASLTSARATSSQ